MSLNVNLGEYGIALNLNVNYNLGANTSLQLDIIRPSGSIITRTNGVTAPATPLVTTDAGTYAASQYATYLFQAGDLIEVGLHSVRLTYTDLTKRLVSEYASFMVNP